jgi:hypothetical protein
VGSPTNVLAETPCRSVAKKGCQAKKGVWNLRAEKISAEKVSGTFRGLYRGVVLTVPLRRQADMTARLTGRLVVEFRQGLRETAAGQITRQSHAAKTSSRTKCKRITFGRSASSK